MKTITEVENILIHRITGIIRNIRLTSYSPVFGFLCRKIKWYWKIKHKYDRLVWYNYKTKDACLFKIAISMVNINQKTII